MNLPVKSPGNGCHGSLMSAANICIKKGLSPDESFQAIRASIPAGARKVPDREIWDAVNKAARECHSTAFTASTRKPFVLPAAPKPKIDGQKLLAAIQARGDGATESDLLQLSPCTIPEPPEQHWLVLFAKHYQPDDILFCGGQYDASVYTASHYAERFSRNGCMRPFIIPNTFTGERHPKADGTLSFRCDAAVKNYRFTVVEHDTMPEAQQLAFWFTAIRERLLDVACLIHSGGKSIHGWVRADAADAADYKAKVAKLWTYLEPMGFDTQTKNPARLSRLAGHYRKDKCKWQRLLYLAPRRTSQDALQRVEVSQAITTHTPIYTPSKPHIVTRSYDGEPATPRRLLTGEDLELMELSQ